MNKNTIFTPYPDCLRIACENSDQETIRHLINNYYIETQSLKSIVEDYKYSVKPEIYNYLAMRVACLNNDDESVKYLLEHNDINIFAATDNIVYICEKGYIEILEHFTKYFGKNIDINICRDSNGFNAMYTACINGHIKIIKHLVKYYDVDIIGDINNIILNVCEYGGYIKVLEFLADNYKDEISSECVKDCINEACESGYTEIVKHLINEYNTDFLIGWPVSVSCEKGYVEIFEFLIERYPEDVKRAVSYYDDNVEFFNACNNGHEKIVEMLIEHFNDSIDITSCDDDDTLYTACYNDPFDITFHNNNAFCVACYNGHEKVVEILTRNYKEKIGVIMIHKAIYQACYRGHEKVVEHLMENYDNIIIDPYKQVYNKSLYLNENVKRVLERIFGSSIFFNGCGYAAINIKYLEDYYNRSFLKPRKIMQGELFGDILILSETDDRQQFYNSYKRKISKKSSRK